MVVEIKRVGGAHRPVNTGESSPNHGILDNGTANPGNGGLRPPRELEYLGLPVFQYSGKSFVDHKEQLVVVTAKLMSAELGWSPDASFNTMERGLRIPRGISPDSRFIPSVLVFEDGNGNIIGASAQKYIELETEIAGKVPFLQHLLRAFKEEYRRGGRGRYAVRQAQSKHDQAEYYGHCTQSAAAIYANQQSGILVSGEYFPIDQTYDRNPKAREIMFAYYLKRRANLNGWVDERTGVSKGDFPEPNLSYAPNPGHRETTEIYERMRDKSANGFKMTFPSRDALHGVGRLK